MQLFYRKIWRCEKCSILFVNITRVLRVYIDGGFINFMNGTHTHLATRPEIVFFHRCVALSIYLRIIYNKFPRTVYNS